MNAMHAPALPLTPSRDAERTRLPRARRLRSGLEAWLHGFVGRWHRREAVRQAWALSAENIDVRREQLSAWSDAQLAEELARLRTEFRRAAGEDALPVPAALAATAEIARRTLGLDAHRGQVMGACGLWRGGLVEMATGEGKTLTLGLAAVLHGWQRRPCHIVTANDYLAARDAKTLRKFYERCGVSVGHVVGAQPLEERRAGYAADVTYTTAKELVADFLRDRLQLGPLQSASRRAVRALVNPLAASFPGLVQRGLHTVLVDEADHVLIDEAATPLIISRARRNALLADACREATARAAELRRGEDYEVDAVAQAVDLKPAALARVRDEWTPEARVFRNRRWRVELVSQALKAWELFVRDKHYVVREGRVVIVDEGTGRPQAQRSWRQGLHQMIEAKENLPLTDPAETLASVSFQKFFRQVPRLAGVTGTAAENAAEFWRVYGLAVIAVPTHRPCVRLVAKLRVCATAAVRWRGVVENIARVHAAGQPVLVGTRSVMASEHLATLLAARGLACAVLNARQLDCEAEIVAQAGQRGRVTIATNLAGRGTDIKLGDGIAAQGGLGVIATERHAAGRIDRQLHGRAARQGDPGDVWPWASLDDDLATRFLPSVVRNFLSAALRHGWRGAASTARGALRFAQWRAERQAARQRIGVLRRDEWLEEFLSG